MANITALDKKFCTGCSLCVNVCPIDAIKLKADNEGFLFPLVDENKCVNCGLCAKKCPQLTQQFSYEEGFKSYAAWAKDDIREKGGSGGIFPLIAQNTIKEGGVVYGAAFDESFRNLSHIRVDKKEELPRLYKSKYVQSDVSGSFKSVKDDLEAGKRVVFSGCPCQVDSLKQYLKKSYEKLLTIDILCHGTPSPLAYNKFLDEVSHGRKITGVDFRNKKWGWGKLISVNFDNNEIHYDHYNGAYLRAFSSGISMRESCNHCKYACVNRVGDITLGDFWGVDQFKEDWNDKKGTSIILCNTEKGENELKSIEDKLKRIEEVPAEQAIEISKKANGALVRPVAPHKMRKCFFYHLGRGDSFSKALAYAEQSLMDIGIVGWWIETKYSNYGSTVTDYALYRYLASKGLSVATISPPNFDRAYAGEFNKKYGYRMTAKYTPENMKENNKYFDGYVVASDVLWYYKAFIKQGYNFMLDFADDSKRKISYSTSFGNTINFFPDEDQLYARYLLKRFDHISVREFEAVDICKNKFDVEATQVLDPVFLCPMEDWEKIASNSNKKTQGDFVFAYLLDPTPEKAKALGEIAKRLKCKLVTITDKQVDHEKKVEILKHHGIIDNANIEDFIYHLKNAKFVVADSFHGFCFALIFDRPFVALVNRQRGGSRFDSLAGQLEVKDRMVESPGELLRMSNEFLLGIDSEKIQANIKREADRSKKWLDNAIFSKREPKNIPNDVLIGKELFLARKHIEALNERIAKLEEKIK